MGTVALDTYVEVLRTSLTFRTPDRSPDTSHRIVLLQVDDASSPQPLTSGMLAFHNGYVQIAQLNVVSINDPPSVSDGGSNAPEFLVFKENDAGDRLAVAPAATVADVDNVTLASATITITTNFEAGKDTLAPSSTLPAGIESSSFNGTTGVLTVLASSTGGATGAAFEELLRGVTFATASPTSEAARSVTLAVSDGRLSTNFTVSVMIVTKPRILTQPTLPSSFAGEAGTPLQLSLEATGTAPLSYHWQKLDATTDTELKWSDNLARDATHLDFIRALYEDGPVVAGGARYHCVVSNDAGTVISDAVLLQVSKGPPTWYTEESKRQLIAPTMLEQTDTIVLLNWLQPAWNGYAADTAAPFNVWYKRNTTSTWGNATDFLTGSVPIELLKDAAATEIATSTGVTWSFKVTAKNSQGQFSSGGDDSGGGTDPTLDGVIPGPEAPVITVSPSQAFMTGDPGTSLSVAVAANGQPSASYQWFRNGVAITGQDSSTLSITDLVKADHDGTYKCVAKNYVGEAETREFSVVVNEMPSVTAFRRLPEGKVTAGAQVIFVCEASGIPQPTLSWQRNGLYAPNLGVQRSSTWAMTADTTTESANAEDGYQCVATNSVGSVKSSALALELAPCGPGTYRSSTGSCKECSMGQFQDSDKHVQASCKTCASGRASTLFGAQDCALCATGKYQKRGAGALSAVRAGTVRGE
jgi:hypothetical protein